MELVLFEDVPVFEVHQLKNTVPVKFQKQKVTLPFDENNRYKYYIIPFMNTSIKSIADILNGNHPIIKNQGNLYKGYFYDFRTVRTMPTSSIKLMPSTTVAQAKKKRMEKYEEFSNLCPIGKPIIAVTAYQGKNFIYDYQPYIEELINHPKLNSLTLIRRIDTFFMTLDHILNITQSSCNRYNFAPIMINLDEYKDQTSINKFHLVTYLLTIMKKSQAYIDRYKLDCNVILYTKRGFMLINLGDDLDKKILNQLRLGLKKLKPDISIEEVEANIEKEDIAVQVNNKLSTAMTGDTSSVPISADSDVVDKLSDKIVSDEENEDQDLYGDPQADEEEKELSKSAQIEAELESNPELKEALVKTLQTKATGGEKVVSKRDALLREKQRKIQIHGKTIEELTSDIEIPEVKVEEISEDMAFTSNENMRKVRFSNSSTTYEKELRDRDIAKILTMYNDKTINMNVIKVESENTSDVLNLKETYKVTFEDELRRRHTVKFNLPIFVDDNLMYINGNLVSIQNQITGLPVIKTSPDQVQICTNYNKIWCARTGTKFNPNMEKFKKFLVQDKTHKIHVVKGDCTIPNAGKLTCLEYDQLALKFSNITIEDCHFIFDTELLASELPGVESTMDKYLIGYRQLKSRKEPLWYDKNNTDNVDLVSTIINYSIPDYYPEFKKLSAGKKYMYTNTKIMEKWIPMIVLLCFFEGITKVVEKFNDPRVEIVDQKEKGDNNYFYIQFQDCYIRYPMSDMEACLMFNGLSEINTQAYSITDLDDRQTFIDIFEYLTGSGFIAGGIINFYDFMMDPITVEICQSLGLPTDLVSLMIYANNLLADSQYNTDISLKNYRNRKNEVVQAILYKQMALAYSRYRASARNNNPTKISVDPDCVIKNLQKTVTVGDYTKMGPIVEMKDRGLASMRGYAGMNLDDAYNKEKRAFDADSMNGIVGVSTDNAGNAGKERQLVLEPNIVNARGFYQITDKKDVKELSMEQLATPLELMNPGGLLHDDPVRTAMATKQRGHAVPVRCGCPLLVSTGIDTTIHFRTGNDYSVVAKNDGVVEDRNDELGLLVVKYKDGSRQVIDISMKIAKAGGEGIYLRNQLSSSFKKGDKFKKDAILAFDKNFYKDAGYFGNRLQFGALFKSMIMSNQATYEDSQWFTSKVSHDAALDVTEKKSVSVGKNATVEFVVKAGDHIRVGDELMKFDTSYEDKELNRLLSGVRDDLQETIIDIGKTKIRSKVDGIIDKVLVYPAVPLEECSPSLQKYIKYYQDIDKKRMSYVDKLDPEHKGQPYRMNCFLNNPVGTVTPDPFGKIKGKEATDSVVFEFYITFVDEVSDGDKLVHQNANKATEADMIPEGYEPYSEFRPYEEISIIIAPSAILARGTPSIIPTMLIYKALIELKRKHYEILTGETWEEKQKRENGYMNTEKLIKGVTESTAIGGNKLSEKAIWILESNGIACTNNAFYAQKIYDVGDVIAEGLWEDGCTATEIAESMRTDGRIKNIVVNEHTNQIIARTMIYPTEYLSL